MHVQNNNVFQRLLESAAWQGIAALVAVLSLVLTVTTFLLNLIVEYGKVVDSITSNGWDTRASSILQAITLAFKDVYFLVALATIILVFASPLLGRLIGVEKIKVRRLRMIQKWTLNFCLFGMTLAVTLQRTAAVLVLSIALIQILNHVQSNYLCKDGEDGTIILSSNPLSSQGTFSNYQKAERLAASYSLTTESSDIRTTSLQAVWPERTQPIPRPPRPTHEA